MTDAQKVEILTKALKGARLDLYAQRGYRIKLGHPTDALDRGIMEIQTALGLLNTDQ